MMTDIAFISQEYLRDHTFLNQNVDMSDIQPFIYSTQDMYIQDILGSTFYNYLLGVYSAQTLNANEQILMGHIKPALAYKVGETSIAFITLQTKNKGIQLQQGDFSSSISLDQLVFLEQRVKNFSSFYETRLVRYLKLNCGLFPIYEAQQNAKIDMHPNKSDTIFDSGLATYPSCVNYKNNINRFY